MAAVTLVIPSRADGEESPAQECGGFLAALGMTESDMIPAMMKVFAITITICSLVLFGCATTTVSNDADMQIRAAIPRFMEAFNRSDWNAVAGFYTDDAVVLAPNTEIARGPAAIRQTFSGMEAMRPNLSFSPDRIVQSGDMAYEYGTYRMQITPSGAATITDRGKYLTVWRRMPNGEWKIAADMFNTSMPAPAP
jgi:ketosteroid isomerase-like protein